MTCRHGPDAAMQTCILCAAAQTRAEQAERDARLGFEQPDERTITVGDLAGLKRSGDR